MVSISGIQLCCSVDCLCKSHWLQVKEAQRPMVLLMSKQFHHSKHCLFAQIEQDSMQLQPKHRYFSLQINVWATENIVEHKRNSKKGCKCPKLLIKFCKKCVEYSSSSWSFACRSLFPHASGP